MSFIHVTVIFELTKILADYCFNQRLPLINGRVPIGARKSVPEGEVLTVVVVVVQMVVRVVSRTIDVGSEKRWYPVVAVVDADGPEVYQEEQDQEDVFVDRKKVGIDVVGHALQETVQWMEGVAGKGAGDLPGVVLLVEVTVDQTMM